MPRWLFCDRYNYFDFTLFLGLSTGFVIAPFAAMFGLATVVGICWKYAMILIGRPYRD